MFGLDPSLSFFLVVCIIVACAFEFVNGFHDTANAVATVIYTKTLKPTVAVIWSGFWNFIGVIKGGVDVAMGIVILLPLEALALQDPFFGVSMVLALLISAIIWNLTTWYLGIPCSSSHTLIGSIIGVGLAFQLMPENISNATVNWGKAGEIGTSLLISPAIGFGATILMMFIAERFIKNRAIFEEPKEDKKAPFWIKATLVGTCTAVSYAHGNNDGQKGVGLIMVILIAFVPLQFALNHNQDIRKTAIDVNDVKNIIYKIDTTQISATTNSSLSKIKSQLSNLTLKIEGLEKVDDIIGQEQLSTRNTFVSLTKNITKLTKADDLPLSAENKDVLKMKVKNIQKITDYTPLWVVVLISLSLGIGTMVGWKRIVVTIGEKIGKSHLTYAQGASSELVAATTIYGASMAGLPVSTTQVLTSAIAGSMVSKQGLKNLQGGTLKSIAIAWIATLPVCIVLSGSLFWIFKSIFVR